MTHSRNALAHLCSRYRAVLRRCRLLNLFGAPLLATGLALAAPGGEVLAWDDPANPDLTISNSETVTGPVTIGSIPSANNYKSITVDGGTLKSTAPAGLVQVNEGGVVTVQSGTVSGIDVEKGGSLVVEGGRVEKLSAADPSDDIRNEVNGGSVTVTGGALSDIMVMADTIDMLSGSLSVSGAGSVITNAVVSGGDSSSSLPESQLTINGDSLTTPDAITAEKIDALGNTQITGQVNVYGITFHGAISLPGGLTPTPDKAYAIISNGARVTDAEIGWAEVTASGENTSLTNTKLTGFTIASTDGWTDATDAQGSFNNEIERFQGRDYTIDFDLANPNNTAGLLTLTGGATATNTSVGAGAQMMVAGGVSQNTFVKGGYTISGTDHYRLSTIGLTLQGGKAENTVFHDYANGLFSGGESANTYVLGSLKDGADNTQTDTKAYAQLTVSGGEHRYMHIVGGTVSASCESASTTKLEYVTVYAKGDTVSATDAAGNEVSYLAGQDGTLTVTDGAVADGFTINATTDSDAGLKVGAGGTAKNGTIKGRADIYGGGLLEHSTIQGDNALVYVGVNTDTAISTAKDITVRTKWRWDTGTGSEKWQGLFVRSQGLLEDITLEDGEVTIFVDDPDKAPRLRGTIEGHGILQLLYDEKSFSDFVAADDTLTVNASTGDLHVGGAVAGPDESYTAQSGARITYKATGGHTLQFSKIFWDAGQQDINEIELKAHDNGDGTFTGSALALEGGTIQGLGIEAGEASVSKSGGTIRATGGGISLASTAGNAHNNLILSAMGTVRKIIDPGTGDPNYTPVAGDVVTRNGALQALSVTATGGDVRARNADGSAADINVGSLKATKLEGQSHPDDPSHTKYTLGQGLVSGRNITIGTYLEAVAVNASRNGDNTGNITLGTAAQAAEVKLSGASTAAGSFTVVNAQGDLGASLTADTLRVEDTGGTGLKAGKLKATGTDKKFTLNGGTFMITGQEAVDANNAAMVVLESNTTVNGSILTVEYGSAEGDLKAENGGLAILSEGNVSGNVTAEGKKGSSASKVQVEGSISGSAEASSGGQISAGRIVASAPGKTVSASGEGSLVTASGTDGISAENISASKGGAVQAAAGDISVTATAALDGGGTIIAAGAFTANKVTAGDGNENSVISATSITLAQGADADEGRRVNLTATTGGITATTGNLNARGDITAEKGVVLADSGTVAGKNISAGEIVAAKGLTAEKITTNKTGGTGNVTVGILGTAPAEAYNIQVGSGEVAGTLTLNHVAGRLSSSTAGSPLKVAGLTVQGNKSDLQAYKLTVSGGSGTVTLGEQARLTLDDNGELRSDLIIKESARLLAAGNTGGDITGNVTVDGSPAAGSTISSRVLAKSVQGNITVQNGAGMALVSLGVGAGQTVTLEEGALLLGSAEADKLDALRAADASKNIFLGINGSVNLTDKLISLGGTPQTETGILNMTADTLLHVDGGALTAKAVNGSGDIKLKGGILIAIDKSTAGESIIAESVEALGAAESTLRAAGDISLRGGAKGPALALISESGAISAASFDAGSVKAATDITSAGDMHIVKYIGAGRIYVTADASLGNGIDSARVEIGGGEVGGAFSLNKAAGWLTENGRTLHALEMQANNSVIEAHTLNIDNQLNVNGGSLRVHTSLFAPLHVTGGGTVAAMSFNNGRELNRPLQADGGSALVLGSDSLGNDPDFDLAGIRTRSGKETVLALRKSGWSIGPTGSLSIGDGAAAAAGEVDMRNAVLEINAEGLTDADKDAVLRANKVNLNGAALHITNGTAGQKVLVYMNENGDAVEPGLNFGQGNIRNYVTTNDLLLKAEDISADYRGRGGENSPYSRRAVYGLRAISASEVLPDIDPALEELIDQAHANDEIGPKYSDSDQGGQRFLSRLIDTAYGGKNPAESARALESLARIAGLLVPYPTRQANWASMNAVFDRLRPRPGSQISNMNEAPAAGDSQDTPTGLAMWITPLYRDCDWSGLRAGNFKANVDGGFGGVVFGADYTTSSNLRLGLSGSAGAGQAKNSGDLHRGVNDMTYWGLGAYAGWTHENFGLTADINFTASHNRLKLDVPDILEMPQHKGSFDAWSLSAIVRGDYTIVTPLLDLTPHAAVRYTHVETEAYELQSGGLTTLSGDAVPQDIWSFPVGLTLAKDFSTESAWSLRPSLDLHITPNVGDLDYPAIVSFPGVTGSAVLRSKTQTMEDLTAGGTLGLELTRGDVSLGISYDLELGKHSRQQGIFASFRYEF